MNWNYKTKHIPIIDENVVDSWGDCFHDIKNDFKLSTWSARAKNFWHTIRYKKTCNDELLAWDYVAFKEFVKELLDHKIINFTLSHNDNTLEARIVKMNTVFRIQFFMGTITLRINDTCCMDGTITSKERAKYQAVTAFHWFLGMYNGDMTK
jgi:hypothetical protein